MTAAAPVTDVHVHVQPWEMIRPAVLEAMRRGRDDLDTIRRCFDDPGALLAHLDREGVERAVLINYESPDVMGFSTATNEWVLRYTQGHRERLLPCVGVNPRFEPDVRGRAERLADGGARLFKVHGPHMLVSPNDYLGAFPALRDLYEVAQARGIPVMFHTGTSIFRGARSKHGDPLQLEDVGVDFPDLDVVITPVGGGGLLSGTSLTVKGVAPRVRVIAGEPENADDAYRSLQAGRILPSENPKTLADGLLTSLGALTFPIIRENVEQIVTVSEAGIAAAMKFVWERAKIIIEPSSAVAVGVLWERKIDLTGLKVGVILSGGNVDLGKLPWQGQAV